MNRNGRARVQVAAVFAGLALLLMAGAGCESLSEGPPTDLRLSAASDTTVRVSWTAPGGRVPDSYIIAFKETGTQAWLDVGTATDSATQADHNPSGKTGWYRVTAVYGSRSHTAAQTPTSAPVHTGSITLGELNGTAHSGYGWDRDSGAGSPFTMGYASNGKYVDFYFTDWSAGSAGPAYFVASPDWGPYEPGGRGFVPVGPWRPNWFSLLAADAQAPLAAFDSAVYASSLELLTDSTLAAVVCTDSVFVADTIDTFVTVSRHYAIARFGRPDPVNGTVKVETWFQAIRDLRLIQH